MNAGDIIDNRYKLEQLLGQGGFSSVYRAIHLKLKQPVAIKILTQEHASDSNTSKRFLREARVLFAIQSDYIARVFDLGTHDDGTPYMVMEYLNGSDLRQHTHRKGRMHWTFAVQCILDACKGVAELHKHGLVHRDLKPSNLFLTTTRDGNSIVKVLDLGITKLVEDQLSKEDPTLTETGAILGTPGYTAPEQLIRRSHVDARADIWALGVCLYELITGENPFHANDIAQICYRVLNDTPVPVHQKIADVPEELSKIIERCIAQQPEKRFQTVSTMIAALTTLTPLLNQHRAAELEATLTPSSHTHVTGYSPILLNDTSSITSVPMRSTHVEESDSRLLSSTSQDGALLSEVFQPSSSEKSIAQTMISGGVEPAIAMVPPQTTLKSIRLRDLAIAIGLTFGTFMAVRYYVRPSTSAHTLSSSLSEKIPVLPSSPTVSTSTLVTSTSSSIESTHETAPQSKSHSTNSSPPVTTTSTFSYTSAPSPTTTSTEPSILDDPIRRRK